MKEVEATLVISSEDPQAVVEELAALTAIASYQLLPQSSWAIHDYYVDTPDRILRQAHLSLRVREIDEIPYLTFKGPPQRIGPGVVEQLEIEAPWSQEALARVAKELARQGVRILAESSALDNIGSERSQKVSPLNVLADLGLQTVQRRENRRQVRNVVTGVATEPALAELAIDSVVYHLASQKVRHYEIEIEAKTDGGLPALKDIMKSLAEAYPATLLAWDHGKLSTGRAIQELLDEGVLAGLIGPDGNLKPAAYEKIHTLLQAKP
jgi:inorganic triphosphatase YgiF